MKCSNDFPFVNRFKGKNLIGVAFLPGPDYPKDVHSFFAPIIKELNLLSRNGMDVTIEEGMKIHPKVHVLVQSGDISMISEVHHLSGNTSYYGCRYCTIRADNISNTRCFGYATNETVGDYPARLRTIEDYKEGDEVCVFFTSNLLSNN